MTVAPARVDYRDRPDYRKILATFDFSRHSGYAAKRAGELAQEYEADLLILNVIEQEVLPGYHQAWREAATEDLPAITVEAERSVSKTLGEAGVSEHELFVEVGSGKGRVHKVITEFAATHNVDLIVMGTHGLSGVEHMLLGSTTERVVRTAPCPVLTFHAGDSDPSQV
jgi:nucleotide-binding universal stress UspA family protein